VENDKATANYPKARGLHRNVTLSFRPRVVRSIPEGKDPFGRSSIGSRLQKAIRLTSRDYSTLAFRNARRKRERDFARADAFIDIRTRGGFLLRGGTTYVSRNEQPLVRERRDNRGSMKGVSRSRERSVRRCKGNIKWRLSRSPQRERENAARARYDLP